MSDQRWTVAVEIMPKQGVNDPQGEAVRSGLDLMGYRSVISVRMGKTIHLLLSADSEESARAQATEMCDKLLANPVIEEYTLQIAATKE